jgi:general transcription factor 3C polypeptide 3 (transcription factor C subunit 4)
MITSTSHRTRIDTLRDVHRELGVDANENRANYVGSEPSPDELMEVFVKLLDVLCHKRRDERELVRMAFSAFTCTAFVGREAQLDFYALMALYLSRNKEYCYGLAKAVIVRNLNNNQVWNLFCTIMSRFYQDLRHNRFCLRLFVKHPELLALAFFNGHNALMSGSYKHALAEYVNIHKLNPKDPFAAFCVSLGFLHLACQKFISNRHSVVIQLCAFLELYLQLRGECQESLYNVGRAFHQLGLVHNSIQFYKKALECPVNVDTTDTSRRHIFDIRREIAYNLSLIYQNSGSNDLALYYLNKYIVI